MNFAEIVSTRLKALSMNQRQLAQRAGLTPMKVSRLLTGKEEPSLAVAESLLKAVGGALQPHLVDVVTYKTGLAHKKGLPVDSPELWEQ
ncbi:helix-turn-helix protein [Caulifigura coniformis]|uniref:Helix-turn-helix protein n=1 Tax=Caulifigura coniformis TaxID=2527983 RepID=A0A517SHB4_9PLAN|nr:helix-turn-helix transcriptional regulator [Caulifigura coniformis]QDT55505.1 helix-turn-helix protein [Caulifigura coniformis]